MDLVLLFCLIVLTKLILTVFFLYKNNWQVFGELFMAQFVTFFKSNNQETKQKNYHPLPQQQQQQQQQNNPKIHHTNQKQQQN